MENDDDGAQQADSTSKFPQGSEFFFQEVGSQNSSDQDGERTQRRHENSWGKGVRCKIADLSNDHFKESSVSLPGIDDFGWDILTSYHA